MNLTVCAGCGLKRCAIVRITVKEGRQRLTKVAYNQVVCAMTFVIGTETEWDGGYP
jgi:hypothetical protein